MSLRESQNYIWNTKCDCLGEGTFGKVYLGIHKKTGDKVAVKTFKHLTQQISKETEMLQSLKHQYIIQLLALEYEEDSGNLVMVMELCIGGSLMDYLNEPENVFGLTDGEFLLVFEHLSGGLEYLKRYNVIHRDVKPDNIMRHVLDDGRIVYKLADFGTARELPEGQNFYSLHGTEPYLNPQIFEACFFQDGEFKRFGANTDLWSIGVTLYQTATGNLPFKVQDRHVMLMVYNTMKGNEGIISATQHLNSEEVIFKKDLPQRCQLSCGLKEIITPIIAGLFKQDPKKQWSFTQYYEQVLEILSRKVINVFYINQMQMLRIYIKSKETFSDFKNYVFEQTGVAEENQVFLYKQVLIVNCFEDFNNVGSECVFLFDRSNPDVESSSGIHLDFDNLSNFHSKFMGDSEFGDFRLANVACKDLCVCKNLMDYQSTVYKYFIKFIQDFRHYCKEEQKEHHKLYDVLIERYTNSKVNIEKLQSLIEIQDVEFIEQFRLATNNFIDQVSNFFENLNNVKIEVSFNEAHNSYLNIVVKELSDMKKLSKELYSLKQTKKLYEYEKIKIVHCVRTIMELLIDKMEPSFEDFVNNVKLWYKKEFFSQVRTLTSLKKVLHRYKKDLKSFEDRISFQSDNYLKTIASSKDLSFNKQKLLDILDKYKENNEDLSRIVEENVKLIRKMTDLLWSVQTEISTDL